MLGPGSTNLNELHGAPDLWKPYCFIQCSPLEPSGMMGLFTVVATSCIRLLCLKCGRCHWWTELLILFHLNYRNAKFLHVASGYRAGWCRCGVWSHDHANKHRIMNCDELCPKSLRPPSSSMRGLYRVPASPLRQGPTELRTKFLDSWLQFITAKGHRLKSAVEKGTWGTVQDGQGASF